MWNENEKKIYVCPATGRSYDPLSLRRKLIIQSKNQFNGLIARLKSSDPIESSTAMESMITLSRSIFEFEPLTILDYQAYDALVAFTLYISKKDPRVQNSPISAPCTDCQKSAIANTSRSS